MRIVKTVTKKVIKEKQTTFINFYVELDNGNLIAIAPKCFTLKDGSDFSSFRELNTIADLLPKKAI